MDALQDLLSEVQRIQCLACVSRHAQLEGGAGMPVPSLGEALRLDPDECEGLVRSLMIERYLEILPSPGAPEVRITAVGRGFLQAWEDSLDTRRTEAPHG